MMTVKMGTTEGRRALILLFAGSLLVASCARPGRPPGGPQDRIPPMVVEIWPDTFEVIEPTRDPAVITFSERISERPTDGRLEDAVLVSPYTGETEVKHTRSGLQVSVIGGFRPDLVYRIRVRRTIKDLFNNPMDSPFELVFSTGGEFHRHVVGGVVTDRITGEPVEGARVEAWRLEPGEQRFEVAEDSHPLVTVTDTAGIFLLRYVPPEAFELQVYLDNNRNREADFQEAQGQERIQAGLRPPRIDTIITSVAILQPDTTPAELIRVEAVDSVLLELSFDDFLMPEQALAQVQVSLLRDEGQEDLSEMTPGPEVERLLWQRQVDSMMAVQDSIRAADSLRMVRDSLRVVADSLQGTLAALQAGGDTLAILEIEGELEVILGRLEPPETVEVVEEEEQVVEEEPILPESVFFALLASPLEPDQPYRIVVSNVVNVNGLPEGGGSVGFTWTPPEPPPGDSTGISPDE